MQTRTYVGGQARTNRIESFWSLLKRGFCGTYHKLSAKLPHRYISEFTGRHKIHDLDKIQQMAFVASGMDGRVMRSQALVDNDLPPQRTRLGAHRPGPDGPGQRLRRDPLGAVEGCAGRPREEGQAVPLPLLSNARQERHLWYIWDG